MPEGQTTDHREQRLAEFVTWCEQHITGDEKSQAQIFLDRFFRAFGHDGLLEAGGEAEVLPAIESYPSLDQSRRVR